jgi:hypothetical protein
VRNEGDFEMNLQSTLKRLEPIRTTISCWIHDHLKTLWFLLLLSVSVTWIVGIAVFLPPVGAQIRIRVFVFYIVAGVGVIAGALWLLHWIEPRLFSRSSRATPVGAVGAVFLAVIGLFGYLLSAQREARRPFLEKQLQTCSDIAGIAGTLATTSAVDIKTWATADANFWADFWGRLGMFEDNSLEGRMAQFGDILKVVERTVLWMNEFWDDQSGSAAPDLKQAALCLAHTCRGLVQETWSVVPGLIRSPEEEYNQYCRSADCEYFKYCNQYAGEMSRDNCKTICRKHINDDQKCDRILHGYVPPQCEQRSPAKAH